MAIDDNSDNLVVLKALLSEAFPQTIFISAQSGKKGIELCISEKPDVVLLDIVMPEMDGYEVCQCLKANQSTMSIPIVMITAARTDKESRIRALEYGADAFLTKPVDESELTAQIRAMLRIKESEDRKLNEKERLEQLVYERTQQLETELAGRKKVERALRDSEERFQMLFNQAPLGYQSLDINGHFIEVNQQWLDTLGYERQEVIGKWFGDFLSPDDQDGFRKRFPLFKSLGQIHSEFEMIHRNGQILDIAFEGKVGNDLNGDFKQTHCILQDITESKRAEKALHESEEKYRTMVDLLPDAVIIHEQGKLVFANTAALTAVGAGSVGELAEIPLMELVHPDFRTNVQNRIMEIYSTGQPSTYTEEKFITLKNEVIDVVAIGIPIKYQGKPAVQTIIRDITAKKRAEMSLKESNEFNESLFQTIPFGMNIVDENGHILFQNKLFKKIYGETAIGSKCWEMYRDDKKQCIECPLKERIEIGKTSIYESAGIQGGKIFEIIHTGLMFKGKKAMLEIFQDITERKMIEEEMRTIRKLLEQTFEQSPVPMVLVSMPDAVIRIINPACLAFLGIEGEPSLINTSFLDIKPSWKDVDEKGKSGSIEELPLTKSLAGIKTEGEERLLVRKDGTIRYELVNSFPIFNDNGQVIAGHLIMMDITDRKHAEEEIQKSHDLFEKLAKQAPGVLYTYRLYPDGRSAFPYSSPGIEKIYEVTSEEVRNDASPVFTRIHPEDLESIIESITESARNQNSYHSEFRVILPRQGLQWRMCDAKPKRLEDGSTLWYGIITDITERKLAELTLKASEERYRSFISQVSEGVYRFESDQPMDLSLPLEEQIDFIYDHFFIAECNQAMLKIYGLSDQNEMIGKTQLDFHGGRNNPVNRAILRNYIRNGFSVENGITEEFDRTGHKKYISNNSIGIIEGDYLVRIWGTETDVTEKVKADQIQQVLYAISRAALLSFDLNELIQIISQEIGTLLDSTNFYIAFYDEKTDMLSTIYERDEKDVIESWSAENSVTGYVIKQQKSVLLKDIEVEDFFKNTGMVQIGTPSKVWLGVPLLMNKKAIGAVVVQSYDNQDAYDERDKQMLEFISHQISISIERKKAEQELNEALLRAKESDRLKSAFLANMSHEIRTPLNSIIGFSDLLLNPDFESIQHKEFAELINNSGNSLLYIINDIMDISKIEAGLVQLNKKVFPVQNLIAEIQSEYSFRAQNKNIELRLDPLNPIEEIFIESDENKIRQILINLVGNAIKFTEVGFIEIGLRTTDHMVRFLVRDTGIGISEEYHDKIFDRFRQVESSETRKYGGNGLGLAISKSLAEMLGGEIRIESTEGKGSTFYLTIPLS